MSRLAKDPYPNAAGDEDGQPWYYSFPVEPSDEDELPIGDSPEESEIGDESCRDA